jgi:hypothetical protein
MQRYLALIVLGLSSLTPAQELPKAEFFGGYQYLRLGGNTSGGTTSRPQSFHGWDGSFVYNFNKHVGVTGDVGGGYAKISGISTQLYTFTAGPMVWLRPAGRIAPFVHALFGAAYARAATTSAGVTTSASLVGSTAIFGGGVEAKVKGALSVRVIQADWLYYHFGSSNFGGVSIPAPSQSNNVRLSIGLVYRFTPFS